MYTYCVSYIYLSASRTKYQGHLYIWGHQSGLHKNFKPLVNESCDMYVCFLSGEGLPIRHLKPFRPSEIRRDTFRPPGQSLASARARNGRRTSIRTSTDNHMAVIKMGGFLQTPKQIEKQSPVKTYWKQFRCLSICGPLYVVVMIV